LPSKKSPQTKTQVSLYPAPALAEVLKASSVNLGVLQVEH